MLFEVVALRGVMPMVSVEMTILIPGPFAWIVPYLHEDLIQQSIQGGEIFHPP